MGHSLHARARWWCRLGCCILSGSLLWLSLARSSQAQITLDGSLGPRGPLNGPNYTIPHEVGQIRGANLFHSFGQFNIQNGESATFSGPPSISNILSRVTGGQPSTIDGVLRSQIPRAHLYLLNPSGVLFGPNATLDVQGSFHVSTADYLRLADGTRFVARLSETTTLSVAPPAAFGFLGPTTAPITVQGSALSVPVGETLAMVGGDLTIAGQRVLTSSREIPTLGAPGGHIHLASVASAGEVLFPSAEPSAGLEVGALPQLGPIYIRSGAFLDASGDGGGTIVIRGGRLLVDHAVLRADTLGNGESVQRGIDIAIRGEIGVTNGSEIGTTTFGPGQGGPIRIVAFDTVSLASSSDQIIAGSDQARIISSIATSAYGTGNAGSVTIEAPRVSLTAGAQIITQSLGPGHSGTVRITASDTVSLSGAVSIFVPLINRAFFLSSGINTSAIGTGNAGSVTIEAPRVSLAGAIIVTGHEPPLSGQAGTVRITASDTVSLSGGPDGQRSEIITSSVLGFGNAGSVIIEAPRVSLTAGGQILTKTFGPGSGGTVRITASDTVSLSGPTSGIFTTSVLQIGSGAEGAGSVIIEAPRVSLTAGGQIRAETGGQGRGGDVVVQAGSLELTGGAQISSSSGTAVGSFSRVGAGAGGTITVTATESVHLHGRDSGLFTRTAGAGQGGNITLHAPRVDLTDEATISAESTGTGNAGNVTITAQNSFLSTHGSVVTRATHADGGNIQITAGHILRLRDSAVTAEVGGGMQTTGGNITIDPQFLVLQRSQISANAFEGHGGTVTINARQVFLADQASTVSASASSPLGINGQVNIQAPVTNISGSVVPLPQAFARTTELLRSRCAERLRGGTVSRFVLGGRDGVPLEPGSWLPSAIEPLDQQPPFQSAQTPQARRSDRGGDGRIDNAGQEQVQGQYAQIRWPDGLDVECARWLGQQRTRQ